MLRPPRILRSWWKEEQRTFPGWRVVAPALLVLTLPLILLVPLEIQRRVEEEGSRLQADRRESLAIIVAALSSIRRTALDWGHWDDLYAFASGVRPSFVHTDIETTSLFDGGAVMVLLDRRAAVLLAYGSAGHRRPGYLPLIRCARGNVVSLRQVSDTISLICRTTTGASYLGVATPISNSTSTAPIIGTLVFFEPLLKAEYGVGINQRLRSLLADFVLHPLHGSRAALMPAAGAVTEPLGLSPALLTDGPSQVKLRRKDPMPKLLPKLLRDLAILLGVLLAVLGVRGLLLLERRRQILVQRRLERRGNQRIFRAGQELDSLLSGLGVDVSSGSGDDRVLARLMQSESEPWPQPEPSEAMEGKLERIADRFQYFLRSAKSLALLDSLTQLPNRRYFIEKLELEAERCSLTGQCFAILFLDIDKFKIINDTYGHAIGDATLVAVSEQLRRMTRSSDFLSRYGGDEFAILMGLGDHPDSSEVGLRTAAHEFASWIAGAFVGPMQVQNIQVELSISIGVNLVNPMLTTTALAMKRSDVAMYRAKQLKHSRIVIYDIDDEATRLDDYQLYGDLMRAVREHQLQVLFQPIVDADGVIRNIEALSRWQHPVLGAVSPETFLELAEKHRQMVPIGEELFNISLQGFRRLHDQYPALRLSLNVAPSKLSDPQLVSRLQDLLSLHGIPPSLLTIELTESSVLDPSAVVTGNLECLRAMGMHLSLDDFGTGYSSLSLLNTLQPDEVKIDKSFVMAMQTDPYSSQVVTLIAGMASRMGLSLVAEGVDNPGSLELLRDLGVTRFQGYLFSRPVSVEDLIRTPLWQRSLLVGGAGESGGSGDGGVADA